MELWLELRGMIGADGFIVDIYPDVVGVWVEQGKIIDLQHGPDFEYVLTDDGMMDWAGNELELLSSSFKQLKTALS